VLELTYDEQTEPHRSAAMMIDRTGLRPGSKTRLWLVAALAAMLAFGTARSASAQSNAHDLMEGRGRDVSFPVSCGADIQPRFDAALAALHSFWYGQALKEFTAIAETKPDCAMAYWGIAMSVWNQIWAPPTPANLKKGSDAITQALALDAKTPRERDYLDALAAFYADYDKLDHRTRATAYMRKMEAIAQRYADDREARIFYALSLLATADGLDKTYKHQLKAGEILEQAFAEKPQHPGPSHYIIHAYDYPALVDRALAAAQNYAICVTVVPHAIHMPSHTYVLLGRWKDVITANDAAETAEADRGTPEDRIHALDYLVYAHLQLGQDTKAKETLDLALKIENDLVARKHETGLRSAWRRWKRAGRWNASTGRRRRGCRCGRAATLTRNRCRISRARLDSRAAAGRSRRAEISSGSRRCRKRWRTQRTSTGRAKSQSSTRWRPPSSSARSAATPRPWR
jgi:hypothetical protein